MKFKVKIKDCQLLVKVKTTGKEVLDLKELDRFARGYFRGFLKPVQAKKNMIEYVGPVSITLYERMQKPITKRDFLFIIEQIVVAVQKMNACNMPLNNLMMYMQCIYINEITKEVQFLYIPTTTGYQNLNLIQLFESIIYSVKPADEKDNEFVSRFVYFFKAMKPFSVDTIEMFVAKEDRSVVNTIKKQNAGQSGFMTSKHLHYYEHYDQKNSDDLDEKTGLLTEENKEATDILEIEEATGLLETNNEATGLLIENDSETEETALLVENQTNVHYPTLFRVLTEETIVINKPVYRLGKEKSYVDYFVTNNIAVSRSHADIITRGAKYFIKDLNSKNHTYINNQEMAPHYEVEIQNGDKIRLGNEEFIFNV